MGNIVKITHAAINERKDPRKEIVKFLWLYRATPQCTTGKAPSVLLNNRKIRTKIPSMIVKPEGREHDEAREREKEEKRKQKQRADVRRKAKEKTVKEGDRILLRRKKTTTKSPWDPDPFVVESVKGGQVTGQRDGERMTRNVLKWKILKERPENLKRKRKEVREEETDEEDDGFDEWRVEKVDQPGEEGQGQQEMVIENREEQQDVSQDREELEEEVQEVGKTWEETFNRSVKNLKGERQRRMPERFRSEVSTEEGSRDRVKKQDSPKQRKRKQSLARHGGGSPRETEQGRVSGMGEYVRLPSGDYIKRRTLGGEK